MNLSAYVMVLSLVVRRTIGGSRVESVDNYEDSSSETARVQFSQLGTHVTAVSTTLRAEYYFSHIM